MLTSEWCGSSRSKNNAQRSSRGRSAGWLIWVSLGVLRSVIGEMKVHNSSRGNDPSLPCRKHPILCIGLYTFMFAPAIAAEISLGRLLTHSIPHPGLLAILCLAPSMIALFIFGMLVGATIWLLVMKRFVHRDVLASFFLGGPSVPIFSNLFSKIFNWTYAEDRPRAKP
jgi:hypothetical protein